MGLQLSKALDKGVAATKCYAKIIAADYIKASELDPELEGIRVIVAFYYNKETRDKNARDYLEAHEYITANLNQETRDQQYAHLKTTDEFNKAIDV